MLTFTKVGKIVRKSDDTRKMCCFPNAGKLFAKRLALVIVLVGVFNIFMIFTPKRNSTNFEKIKLQMRLQEPQEEQNLPDEFNTDNYNLPAATESKHSYKLKTDSVNFKLGEKNVRLQALDEMGKIRPKKILVWNSYWQSKAVWHKIFYEIIYKKCPQSNCILTIDKSDLSSSDAVLFHLTDLQTENYTFPEPRNPNQIWIGMSYEPPYILKYTGLDFRRLNGIFNRTMTYRRDADIVVRHGAVMMIEKDESRFPNYMSNWIDSHEGILQRNYASGKRRLVSWFASSRGCKSQSGREVYVQNLQKYIPVDVYGACGPYKCGVQKTMRNPYKVEHDDCYLLVSVGYKFVLAFENSICEDYVTEKLYNNLKLNVVPIVFGGGNYSYFAPPHSVIDAAQYTPEQLAQYLLLLDKNDTLYNEYFRWKKNFYIEAHDGIPLACDLCEQMHNPNWQIEKKVYENFDQWLVSGCYEGYSENQQGPLHPAKR